MWSLPYIKVMLGLLRREEKEEHKGIGKEKREATKVKKKEKKVKVQRKNKREELSGELRLLQRILLKILGFDCKV